MWVPTSDPRKFDHRNYLLISSIDPLIVYYRQGNLRFFPVEHARGGGGGRRREGGRGVRRNLESSDEFVCAKGLWFVLSKGRSFDADAGRGV